jgi:predicted GNAT family N-acyltransferase
MNISTVSWQNSQAELSMIRTLVFIEEQNVSAEEEMDGKDESAEHFLVRNALGEPIGCARLLIEVDYEKAHRQKVPHQNTLFHIGRVAVLKNYRNMGIGHQLMQTIVQWCLQHGTSHGIYLNAQTERIDFYQRLNFVKQGEIFMDAGIPHIKMWHNTAKV